MRSCLPVVQRFCHSGSHSELGLTSTGIRLGTQHHTSTYITVMTSIIIWASTKSIQLHVQTADLLGLTVTGSSSESMQVLDCNVGTLSKLA